MAFIFLLLSYHLSFSQRFIATASSQEVPLNSIFTITYTIENLNATQLRVPRFDGFDASGPSQESNREEENGRVVLLQQTYTYTLQPKKQGEFDIPSATLITDKGAIKSNAIHIKVVGRVKNQPSNNAYDPFGQEENKQTDQAELNNLLRQNIIIRAIPNKTRVYQGEQLTLSYKLYFGVGIMDIMASKMPAYNGFLSEEYPLDKNRQPVQEKYNGKDLYSEEIMRTTLFPTHSGKFSISPLEFSGVARVYVYDEFGFFAIPQNENFKSASNSVNIDVLPLPDKNKPSAFNGAVGKFSFEAEYDKNKVKVGEPISLKIKYNGSGNFKLITPPKLTFPEEFEVYEPKIKDEYANNGSEVTGSKTFEYTLVPQDGGKFRMPAYDFAYFDVDKADYVKFSLPATEINVEGKAKLSRNLLNFFKRNKEDTPKDIYGIHGQYASADNFTGSSTFWAMTGIPMALLIAGFLFRKRDYSESELISLKRKKANKIALRRMASAKKLMHEKREQEFYNEVIRALWEYVSEKLYIPQSQLSKENIAGKLAVKNIRREQIDALTDTLDTCEQSLFSPQGKENAMQQTYSKAVELIVDFEEQLKS